LSRLVCLTDFCLAMLAAPLAAGASPLSQLAPPALGEMPPNASRITAKVLMRSVWPPGSLVNSVPPVRPDRTLYSLTIELETSAPLSPSVSSLAESGTVIEVFSTEELLAALVGKHITATVRLTGTTGGTRWMISEIRTDLDTGNRQG
jgi:hypothetical protein